MTSNSASPIRIERGYPVPPERVWELWTTASGIERWWAPDGFTVRVETLDLRPGGELVYEFPTEVALRPTADGVDVTMTIQPLHSEEWTGRLVAGRENEMENLAKALKQD
ncbi:SRPBCC domain-containing protein [Streptomyces sp. NPDC056670]|uniref:SRPBCC family protein n=1 Tax=Streptomyces sp. NPDC056670 TaxID=3345904 RepID=UPI00368C906B